jgi:hypothetical protein
MAPRVVIGEMGAAFLRREMIFDWPERRAWHPVATENRYWTPEFPKSLLSRK